MIFLDTLPKVAYQLLSVAVAVAVAVAVGVLIVCVDFVFCILIVWWRLV